MKDVETVTRNVFLKDVDPDLILEWHLEEIINHFILESDRLRITVGKRCKNQN